MSEAANLETMAETECRTSQANGPKESSALALTPGLSIFLSVFARMFGRYAVRPVLGGLATVIGIADVKAEAKVWIANNGG